MTFTNSHYLMNMTHRKTVLTGSSHPLYPERQPKCNQQIVTKSLPLTKNMSKITHQSLDSGHESLRPWTNTTFQLHTFLLRLKKRRAYGNSRHTPNHRLVHHFQGLLTRTGNLVLPKTMVSHVFSWAELP